MAETALKIRLFGDSILRSKARPLKQITQASRDILSQMAQLMYSAQGVGLASLQIGIKEAMIVVDAGSGLYKLINPKITRREGVQIQEEGCLSIPSVRIKVRRAKKILVKAQDEFGKPLSIEAEDLLACVLQHEIDHLNGKLIVDYASFFEKIKLGKKLEELKGMAGDENMTAQLKIL